MVRLLLTSLRLTRLVIDDELGQWLVHEPIDRAMDRYAANAHATPGAGVVEPRWWKFRSGLDCPYCVGFWIGLGVLVGEKMFGRSPLWRTLTTALALNEVVAFVHTRTSVDE